MHGNAKLTDEQRESIKRRRLAGETLAVLAAEYGVSISTVWIATTYPLVRAQLNRRRAEELKDRYHSDPEFREATKARVRESQRAKRAEAYCRRWKLSLREEQAARGRDLGEGSIAPEYVDMAAE